MSVSSSGYDMSTFIRRYSRYLNEKAFAYRQMAFDFGRVKKGYGFSFVTTPLCCMTISAILSIFFLLQCPVSLFGTTACPLLTCPVYPSEWSTSHRGLVGAWDGLSYLRPGVGSNAWLRCVYWVQSWIQRGLLLRLRVDSSALLADTRSPWLLKLALKNKCRLQNRDQTGWLIL